MHVRSLDIVNSTRQYSRMNLVKLAGSEKPSKNESSGNKLTESLYTTKSLNA